MDEKIVVERSRKQHKRKKRRVVSGALLEEGRSEKLRGLRGGARYEKDYDDGGGRRKKFCRSILQRRPNQRLTYYKG